MATGEKQYISLIKHILDHGDKRIGRNGATYSSFGHQMRFSLRNGTLPLLTTKKVAWKTCSRELFWFLRGETNNASLQAQKVRIWDANASREFLDSRGLQGNAVNDLGPIYGFQWNNFNGTYRAWDDFDKDGVDQLSWVVDALKRSPEDVKGTTLEDKFSRRLIVSAWNPQQINQMALPPCHVLFQFYVNSKDELSCHLYQRSGDVGLGVPFNIASYSLLTHIMAAHTGLTPGDFVHSIGDAHIYDDHVEPLKRQIENEVYPFPTVDIKQTHDTLHDYSLDDIELKDYNYHPLVKMDMRA